MNHSHAKITDLSSTTSDRDEERPDAGYRVRWREDAAETRGLAPEGQIVGLDCSAGTVVVSQETNAVGVKLGRVHLGQAWVAETYLEGPFRLMVAGAGGRALRRNVMSWSMAPIIHAPRLRRTEIPNGVDVKTDEEYFFFLACPPDECVLRIAASPGNAGVSLGIARARPRIVRHCDRNHVVERSCLESGGSDLVPCTGIRDDNQFRTVEHELSCRFREFSVGANHGTHAKLIFLTVESANVE